MKRNDVRLHEVSLVKEPPVPGWTVKKIEEQPPPKPAQGDNPDSPASPAKALVKLRQKIEEER